MEDVVIISCEGYLCEVLTSKNSTIKETMGVKFTVSGGVSNSDLNDVGLQIGANLETNWNTEYTESMDESVLEQESHVVEWSKTDPRDQRFFIYQLVEEYKLYRLNYATPILEWKIPVKGRENPIHTFPHSKMEQGSTLKSTGGYVTSFTQGESIDLIPRMYSNTTPSGVASASSSYS